MWKNLKNDGSIIFGLSGGVDSLVSALMVKRTLKNKIYCVFVNHGLMRKNEENEIIEIAAKNDLNLIVVDAKKRFLDKLKGVTNPEDKRKIIGNEFIEVFQEEANKLKDIKYLGQGTIKSDVLESIKDSFVKSHHNVGGLPEKLGFKLVEPCKDLYKDEVRKKGLEMGISKDFINRKPFPGPGLGVRICGEITSDKIKIAKESDYLLREYLKEKNIDYFQAFTVVTNTKSTALRNAVRYYGYVIAVRIIRSFDATSASVVEIDSNFINFVNTKLTKLDNVSRVVYDISNKPDATIEWE